MKLKIGQKVIVNFRKTPPEELERLERECLANTKGKKGYLKIGPDGKPFESHAQQEPEMGILEGIGTDTRGEFAMVRMVNFGVPGRLRRIAADLVEAA